MASHTITAMTSLKPFTVFLDLPIELRLEIWDRSCVRRFLAVGLNPKIRFEKDLAGNEQDLVFETEDRYPPVLLHVHRESRQFGLKMYTALSFVSHKIYFSSERDAICFMDEGVGLSDVKCLAMKSYVQHLICDISMWT
jgi:hypothetical protein